MRGAPPDRFRPQLALLVKNPPDGPDWLHEIKYDGYRIGCSLDRGRVTLYSRNNNDWTANFPEVAAAARTIHAASAFLDGEVAVVLPDGRTSFQALQNAAARRDSRSSLVYFVFDLLYLDGEDLCSRPIEERKERLRRLLAASPTSLIRFSEHVEGSGRAVFDKACRLKLEGIVSKRRGVPYQAGRRDSWVKTKCVNRQEFVVGGFTDPEGSRVGIGALLIGYYDAGGRLVFAGKVGTGFSHKISLELRSRMESLARDKTPFDGGLDTWLARHAHWARPELVAEVTFTEWTDDGKIRHPSFQGLRADKRPEEIGREQASLASSRATLGDARRGGKGHGNPTSHRAKSKDDEAEVAGVRITHAGRVMYPELGVTKLQVARYYEAVADRMLPHLRGRPLTLVRCGDGVPTGEMRNDCIYMKHSKVWAPPALRRVKIRERTKIGDYLVVDSVAGLVSLAQMDVLEIHTWNSTFDHVEEPDRVVFDIDPGPDVPWAWVIEGARLVRSMLARLGLESFVKTTGGKGLHVVMPMRRSVSWNDCLDFSREIAATIVRTDPDRYTMAFAKAGRERKLLVDYLRNNRTNTSVAAFSTRARRLGTVSMPLSWEELTPRLSPDRFTVETALRRLARLKRDPWEGYWKSRQTMRTQAHHSR